MKFDINQLLSNHIYLSQQMGQVEVETTTPSGNIRFILPLGYKIYLSPKGLRAFYKSSELSEHYPTMDEAFGPVRQHLQARLDELAKIPCLQN